MKTAFNTLVFTCIICLSFFTGCKKSSNTSLANFQPQISNTKDNFQLQATDVKQVSTTIDYNWSNTGTMASIDKSGVVTAGTANILIYDNNGTNVYASSLKATGSETTNAGVAGLWKIRLVLSGYDGTLNFRVQKK
jgi:NCAIR mutase (PurE)-related protein